MTKTRYRMLLWLVLLATATVVAAQNVEVTPFAGGQINGGLNVNSAFFHRIEVQNAVNYGASLGYLLGEHTGIEFMWSHNKANTVAQPVVGSSIHIFNLQTNQFLGDFLYHFADRQTRLRPFMMLGLGAGHLAPDNRGTGITRFVFALGGGLKYNFSPHLGARLQAKWSPTFITTTSGGIWCDPFFGCWPVGNNHFLNEFDLTAGLTFRF